MTHLLPSRSIAIASGLFAIVLFACSQGERETCQIDSDCDDGLLCVTARDSERGVCRSPDDVESDASTADADEPDLPDDEDAGTEPGQGQDAGDEPAQEDAGG
jgi:hypothetical protein